MRFRTSRPDRPTAERAIGLRHWPGEQVALHLVTAGEPQQHALLLGLDPFDDHRHAERAAERVDGLDDHPAVRGLVERRHEAAVDLELVEGERLQVAQARIAGAEVVEREAYPERPQ